jgi:hypothetical protein
MSGAGYLDQKTIASTSYGRSDTYPNLVVAIGFGTRQYPAFTRFMNHSEYRAGISVLLLAEIIRLLFMVNMQRTVRSKV